MDRDEIRERFSPLLDGELSPEERAEVEAALSEDAELLRELDALKRVDQLYANLPPEKAPEGFEDGVRSALSPNTLQFTRARFMRRKLWPLLAAAAIFIVFGAVIVVQMNPKSAPTQLSRNMAEPAMESAAGKMHRQENRASDEAVAFTQAQPAAPSRRAESAPGKALTDTEAYPGPGAVSSGSSYSEKPAEKKVKSEIAGERSAAGEPVAAGEVTEEDRGEELQSLGYLSREMPATQSAPPAASSEPPTERQVASAPPKPGAMTGDTNAAKQKAESTAGEALGFAPMPAQAEANQRKEADRVFEKTDGDWIQQGYDSESLKSIRRDSSEWKQLVEKNSKLSDLPKLEGRVVFKLDDTWYELLPVERPGS